MVAYNQTIREADISSGIHIIKRSGVRMKFDPNKIINAIKGANNEMSIPTDMLDDEAIKDIAMSIYKTAKNAPREFSVEEIQDMVEDHLMVSGKTKLARAYIIYRYTHNERRNDNTLDRKIESIIDIKNEDVKQENSNKNPTVVSVQRDYMAGEWSRHYTNEYLLDEEIKNAHEEGIIHFHDSDYFAQKEHNCFHKHTKFIANGELHAFCEFNDGDEVTVLDKDGIERKAIVHRYEPQPMCKIRLSGDDLVTGEWQQAYITCTKNHRWVLHDGSITTTLQVMDVLYTPESNDIQWTVDAIQTFDRNPLETWCVEEPVTHTFQLEKGIVTGNCELINLEDMLQNGTKISGTMIETPKSFATCCTITSQIIAQVASMQYGLRKAAVL